MEMAANPSNKLNMQMPVRISAESLGYSNKITQIAAGIIVSPFMLQIGKNHGTTKSVTEIQNNHFPFVLNRVSAIAQCTSMQPDADYTTVVRMIKRAFLAKR